MKRLLITTDNFLPRWDGIARFLSELIPELKEEYKITIACPAFEGAVKEFPGVKLVRFPLMPIRFGDLFVSWWNRRQIEDLVKQNDIVFNQTLGPIGIAAISEGRKNKKKVISYVHSIEWELVSKGLKNFQSAAGFIMKHLVKKMYNKCNLIVVPSKEIEDLLTMHGISSKMQVVQLGVDTHKFIPPVSKMQAKKKIGIQPSMTVITYIGRLAREKNLGTLYKAFQKVRKEHKKSILLVVGGGLSEDIKADSRIMILGQQENVVPYYQASDIYVLPSLTETTSLTTLEAMACGAAVIVTPVGSIREYVDDGRNGLIFPRRDANTLADMMKFLLTHERTRHTLGHNARKTVVEKRSSAHLTTDIKNALKSV